MAKYFDCYLRGDYRELLTLFEDGAVENGIPVKGSVDTYRTFFRCLKVVKFDFEKEASRMDRNTCRVDGKYVLEYQKVSNVKRFKDEGRISFIVVRDGPKKKIWRIKKVAYHSD